MFQFSALVRIRQNARLAGLAACGCVLVGAPGCPPSNVPPSDDAIRVEKIAEGITAPVALAAPDDGSGRLFVVSQTGLIWRIDPQGGLAPTPFLDIEDRLIDIEESYDERGLLGLAFHPDFVSNGRFFVFYVAPGPEGTAGEARVSEFELPTPSANVADPDRERILLRINKPQGNHNGGALAFGPDGYLYVSVGDGGGAGDSAEGHAEEGNGQSKQTLLGKILRIDVDGEAPYSVPADNPFVDDENARPEIFALGFRNPWRMSFDDFGDAATGRLFAGDVGQGLREEVNIVLPGGNYGWRIREGTFCFNPDDRLSPPADCPDESSDGHPLIEPILDYSHSEGVSVIGGFVYRGDGVPALRGKYLFADYTETVISGNGRLFLAAQGDDGQWSFQELQVENGENGRIGRYIYGFGRDAAGELYIVTNSIPRPQGTGGEVWRVTAVD